MIHQLDAVDDPLAAAGDAFPILVRHWILLVRGFPLLMAWTANLRRG
jgi:hypothetical protein